MGDFEPADSDVYVLRPTQIKFQRKSQNQTHINLRDQLGGRIVDMSNVHVHHQNKQTNKHNPNLCHMTTQ